MARLFTGYIDENDCIGDSLGTSGTGTGEPKSTINENSLALDLAVQSLSAYDNSLRAAITPSGSNLAVTNQLTVGSSAITSLTANNIHLTGQIFNNSNRQILRQSGSIINVSFHSFSDSTTRTGNLQNYASVTNGTINVTSTAPNSRFLVTINGQGYTVGASGANIGLNRIISATTTRLIGVDGGAGDAWMGTSNGYNGAFSITRSILDTPNVASGTVISYVMLLGHWAAGTSYLNYPAYSGQSSIVVYEIAT